MVRSVWDKGRGWFYRWRVSIKEFLNCEENASEWSGDIVLSMYLNKIDQTPFVSVGMFLYWIYYIILTLILDNINVLKSFDDVTKLILIVSLSISSKKTTLIYTPTRSYFMKRNHTNVCHYPYQFPSDLGLVWWVNIDVDYFQVLVWNVPC